MKRKYLKFIIFCLLFGLFSFDVKAVEILGKEIDENSMDGFLQLAVAIAHFILGITGSLALLMFVYGGTMMLISGGNSQKIEKGKNILTNAVIGLVIIFSSYIIVQFIIQSLGVNKLGS